MVGPALLFGVDLINAPGCPAMHRGIDITKLPLIGRQLPVGVHVPFTRHQIQLSFGKIGIDQRKGDAVKGQIPGRVPGILAYVGH